MKAHSPVLVRILLFAFATASFGLTACDKKPQTLGEKVEEKVDDALDRRPGEKVRDAAEDVRDAAKDAGRDIKDATK